MRRPSPVVTRSFASTASHSVSGRPVPAATPRLGATAAPSPAYQRHHDVAAPQVDASAFRQGWRVATRLDGLLERGRIDREQWECALEWRRWAEWIGLSHVQRWDVRADAPCHPSDLPMLRRVQAAARLRACTEALGELRVRILEAVIVHDVSWRALGQQLRMHAETAQERAVEAIAALALHLAGKPVPPPPPARYRIEPGRQ